MLFNTVMRSGSSSVLAFGGNWKNAFGWLDDFVLTAYSTQLVHHHHRSAWPKSSQYIVYHQYQLSKLLERYYLLIWSCRWGVREVAFIAFPLPAEIYWLRPFYHLNLSAPIPLTLRRNLADIHRYCLVLRRASRKLFCPCLRWKLKNVFLSILYSAHTPPSLIGMT